MIYLRDTVGATDADAHNIGAYMMNNHWWECNPFPHVMLVTGYMSNPKDIWASMTDTGGVIQLYIDQDNLTGARYDQRLLAMILYSLAGYFMDPAGNLVVNMDDNALNLRLNGYRTRHSLTNYYPEWRHGAREGVITKN